jgi:hypothetical protein
MLLLERGVGSTGPEMIDARYFAKVLSSEWEFHYTTTTKLGRSKDRLVTFAELTDDDRARVSSGIDTLLKVIEDQPKRLARKMRATVGAKSKLYNDVDCVGG